MMAKIHLIPWRYLNFVRQLLAVVLLRSLFLFEFLILLKRRLNKLLQYKNIFFLQERTKEVKESNLPSATSSSKKSSRSTTTAATITSSTSSIGESIFSKYGSQKVRDPYHQKWQDCWICCSSWLKSPKVTHSNGPNFTNDAWGGLAWA